MKLNRNNNSVASVLAKEGIMLWNRFAPRKQEGSLKQMFELWQRNKNRGKSFLHLSFLFLLNGIKLAKDIFLSFVLASFRVSRRYVYSPLFTAVLGRSTRPNEAIILALNSGQGRMERPSINHGDK